MLLRDKKIVIIGGTSGIGLSAAIHFVKEGAKVVAVGLEEQSSERARQLLGMEGSVLQGDACRPETPVAAIQHCEEKYGGFDGLYHVAGGSGRKWGDGPLHELTLEGWHKTLELNMTSVMLSNQAAVKVFTAQQRSGTILNLSSVLGFAPSPKFFYTHAYATAKAAVIGFSKAIAAYYAPKDIRVNVLAPALVATPMSRRARNNTAIMDYIRTKQPLQGGRIGQPADLDTLAGYFMSDQSRFVTGQVMAVDGGWSISEGQHGMAG